MRTLASRVYIRLGTIGITDPNAPAKLEDPGVEAFLLQCHKDRKRSNIKIAIEMKGAGFQVR